MSFFHDFDYRKMAESGYRRRARTRERVDDDVAPPTSFSTNLWRLRRTTTGFSRLQNTPGTFSEAAGLEENAGRRLEPRARLMDTQQTYPLRPTQFTHAQTTQKRLSWGFRGRRTRLGCFQGRLVWRISLGAHPEPRTRLVKFVHDMAQPESQSHGLRYH